MLLEFEFEHTVRHPTQCYLIIQQRTIFSTHIWRMWVKVTVVIFGQTVCCFFAALFASHKQKSNNLVSNTDSTNTVVPLRHAVYKCDPLNETSVFLSECLTLSSDSKCNCCILQSTLGSANFIYYIYNFLLPTGAFQRAAHLYLRFWCSIKVQQAQRYKKKKKNWITLLHTV